MDARTFIKTYGWLEAEKVAQQAGTNRAYFSQIASGHRRPSVGLAERLVSASGGALDFVALLSVKRN